MSSKSTSDQPLTAKQEAYAQARASGKTKADSYRSAYPNSVNYKPNTVYRKANELEHNGKVAARIAELQKPVLDVLEENRVAITQTAIDLSLGKCKARDNIETTVLNKLLDKLLATKTETKSDVTHTFNIIFSGID